mmetsp:Transcript_45548/g.97679  ORF Transcript_45548/g.97679 Transcript_45548/m.97679 type:complete len:453 (-) Transcript_45548:132-1490(-)
MFNFWDCAEDTPPPPARSAIFVMRNGRYEPQNLMPVLPRPDTLDFDGFGVRRGANANYMNPRPPEMRQAALSKNPVNIRRDSARALRSDGSPMRRPSGASPAIEGSTTEAGKLRFSVTFDALRSGQISVYFLVTEKERVVTSTPTGGSADGSSASASPAIGNSVSRSSIRTSDSAANAAALTERWIEFVPQKESLEGTPNSGSGAMSEEPALPKPLEVKSFEEGLGQVYNSPVIDISSIPEEQLTFSPEHPKDIPVVIRLEADEIESEERTVQYTYLSFNLVSDSSRASSPTAAGTTNSGDNDGGGGGGGEAGRVLRAAQTRQARQQHWSATIVGQKLQYGAQGFVCHEVFGVSSRQQASADEEGGNSECVICLTEPRDTAVLPCRHMCFCGYCAGIVRLQCDRCPVCRQKVVSLLQFKRDKETGESQETQIPAAAAAPAPTTPPAAPPTSS